MVTRKEDVSMFAISKGVYGTETCNVIRFRPCLITTFINKRFNYLLAVVIKDRGVKEKK